MNEKEEREHDWHVARVEALGTDGRWHEPDFTLLYSVPNC